MPPAEDLTNVLLDGRYRLLRLMGEGGMGQVYEGIHETLDRKVAVKVLLPRYAFDPKFRERFLREAKAASKVRHPNVVHIADFGDTPGGSVYFAMEFLEGRDLAALLRAEGPLPWPRVRPILLQAMSALGAAHERKIIHRDVKPANFFVEQGPHGEVIKVLDFGIAKLAADAGNEDSSLAQSLTGTGEVFGTAKYMAPEQAYGTSDDPRVDVYSLGIVAYELLTGQVPFTGVSAFHIITRHVNDLPRPPRELAPEIPPEVEAWILRALAKQPEDRFASMGEMEQALLAISFDVPTPLPSMHSRPSSSAAPPAAKPVAAPPVAKRVVVQPVAQPVVPVAQPVAPVAMPVAPVPASVQPQPRGRSMSDRITTPAHARPADSLREHGSATSMIPTRLKAPSPVTSGELVVPDPVRSPANEVPPRKKVVGRDSEDSGIGASTARVQGAGDDGSATGPTRAHASGRGVADTEPHSWSTASRPTVAPQRRGIVLGLLAALGGGVLVLAGYLATTTSQDDTVEPSLGAEPAKPEDAAEAPAIVGPATQPRPSSTNGESVEGPATPSVPVEPEPPPESPPDDQALVEREATAPVSTEASKTAKRPAPLTDSKVASQLARTLKEKCAALGPGVEVTVRMSVGVKGNVLLKTVQGAVDALEACLAQEAAKARFSAGKTRTVSVEVAL